MIKLEPLITTNKDYIIELSLDDNSFIFNSNSIHRKFNISFKNILGIELLSIKGNLKELIELSSSLFSFVYSDMISDIFYFQTNNEFKKYCLAYGNINNQYNSELITFNVLEESSQYEFNTRISFICDYDFLYNLEFQLCTLLDNVYNLRDIFPDNDMLEYLGLY